jgi:hypothetical protein
VGVLMGTIVVAVFVTGTAALSGHPLSLVGLALAVAIAILTVSRRLRGNR